MKRISLFLLIVVGCLALLCSCSPQKTGNDVQHEQQAQVNREGVHEVGMPNVGHFREMRLLKTIYEMRDQANLASWTYVHNQMTGKFAPFCESEGFPIPYATQFSAPTAMQTYNLGVQGSNNYYGAKELPQPEINGLFMPASAEGSWIMCIGPDKKAHPSYSETRLSTFLYKLPDGMLQQ